MAFAVILAALTAALAGTGVFLVQSLMAHRRRVEAVRQHAITELAQQRGGTLTPRIVAEHLQISVFEADRTLRSMVDDQFMRMAIDDHAAELVFWFTKLTAAPNLVESTSEYSRVRRSESVSLPSVDP